MARTCAILHTGFQVCHNRGQHRENDSYGFYWHTTHLAFTGAQRVRHEPEKTVLYQVVREHLPGFLQSIEADCSRSPLPRFVVRELRAILERGLLCFEVGHSSQVDALC